MNESEFKSEVKNKPPMLTSPMAIIIAGALIAAALYFSGGSVMMRSAPLADEAGGSDSDKIAQPSQPSVGEVAEVTSEDHIRGAKNAKVTIVEYSDFECPFCKRFHDTMSQVLKEYPNDVRWVYRQAPLVQLHSKAPKQSEASECAGEQGKFWELTDKIFEVTPSNNGLDMDLLPSLAQQVGVPNIQQFQSCLDSGKYGEHVAADLKDAQTAGLRGTPYSVVIAANGDKTPINGAQPYESVKVIIDEALKN